jgi:hypothetical protein
MLAVGLSSDDAIKYLEGRERTVTLSGEATAIKELATALTANDVFNRVLSTGSNTYHSHHMVPLG